MMAPFPHGWMKWWNGLGSAILHGNCVQYRHDNLQRRRKKMKQGKGGNNERGVIKDDRTSPDRFCLSTSSSGSFCSAQAHLVSWITDLRICQSPVLWGPWAGDAAPLMELLRCGKLSATSMMAALCWWSHQNMAFSQIKGSSWAIITSGTQVSRGLLRWCVPLGLETLFVLYSMLYIYIYRSCSGETLQQHFYDDTFNVWLWHSILKRATWALIWFKPKRKSLEFINCRGSWEIHVTHTFSVLKWQFIAIQCWNKTHFLTLTTRAVIFIFFF